MSKNKTNLTKITKNAGMTFINKTLFMLLGMVSSVFLARFLGPENRGYYAMVLFLPSTLSMVLGLGIPSSNVYHIAKKINLSEILKFNKLLKNFLSIAGLIIGIIIIDFFSEKLFPGIPKNLLSIGLISYPLLLINSFSFSVFLGLQEIKIYNKIQLQQKVISTILAIFATYFWNIIGAIIAIIISNIIIYIQCKIHITKVTKNDQKNKTLNKNKFIQYGLKSYFSDIIAFLNYKADIFFINFFLNPVLTGVYVVAVSLAEKIWIVTSSISLVINPKLTEISDDENEHTHLTILTAKWVFYLTLFIVIFLGISIKYIVSFLYGAEYSQVVLPFILLLPGICLGAMSKIISNSFASLGKPEINLYMGIVILVINITLNILLIPRFGLIGGAIATSVSYTTVTICKLFILKQLQDIKIHNIFIINKRDLVLFNKLISKIKKSIRGIIVKE